MSGNLRLRVFAGPNGSGKSTIIKSVRSNVDSGMPVDFGIYINADDIAENLRNAGFLKFSDYNIHTNTVDFNNKASQSGLVNEKFSQEDFQASFSIIDNSLKIENETKVERLSQIVADFLRVKLLESKQKFSFETVFSHESKIKIMERAKNEGYKVYLYFVCTEDPEINIFRIKNVRIKQGGHDVPEKSIRERYYRSLGFLHAAAQLTHRSYFFDNSGENYRLFADFKQSQTNKSWTIDKPEPNWFIEYYRNKVK